MYVRKTTICKFRRRFVSNREFSKIAKKYTGTKGDLPNLYLLGILQILLAKYCEAKALDLSNRLMALHRTEENTEEGDKDWCLGKKEGEKVDGKKNSGCFITCAKRKCQG